MLITPVCSIQTTTLAVENTCKIPLDTSMIFDAFINLQNATRLIDEQTTIDPFCEPDSLPKTFWGFDFPANQSISQERLSIDLGAYHNIDILALFDGGGIGTLDIQTADSPNGPWTTLLSYPTISTNDWQYFTDLFPQNQPARYLRFIASEDDMVQLGELFLCGEVSNFNPDELPGMVQNASIIDNSCNSIKIDIIAPFDRDIASYRVIYDGNQIQNFQFETEAQSLTLTDLPDSRIFNFSIVTVDNIGQESLPFPLTGTTFPATFCQPYCTLNCPTQLCLQPSWITDLTPVKPTDYDPIRLVDEQATAPICGNSNNPSIEWGVEFDPNDGVPPIVARLDLQAVYNLDTIFLFDGNSAGTFVIEYLDEEEVWQPLFNYFTVAFNEWIPFEHASVHARFLRLTKLDSNANINEIVIHAGPYIPIDSPSGMLANFTASNISCDAANLTWDLSTNSLINQLNLVITTTVSSVEVDLPNNTNSYTINNLLPKTVYECFLYAKNMNTTPIELAIKTFQTPNCGNNNPPNAVTNLAIIQTGCEEVTLSWIPPNEVAYYQLMVQPSEFELSFPSPSIPIAFTINKLQENTNYTFELKVIDFNGNESTTKTVTTLTQTANQCDDDENEENCIPNCPTFICIEEEWVNDLTPTEHLDARRLFDEPELGNTICGESGTPKSSWGEDYNPDAGVPPIIAIVDLQEIYNLEAIHLFDIESDGKFIVEYKNNNGDWLPIANYYTLAYRKWHELNNLNLSTQYLRFTKLDNSAKIGEIAIFGLPVNG